MTAPTPTNADFLGTSPHFVTYTDASSPVNLVTEGLAPCRRIRCQVAGTLVVKRASDKTSITLNFLAGETQEVSATDIVSGGATGITVYW